MRVRLVLALTLSVLVPTGCVVRARAVRAAPVSSGAVVVAPASASVAPQTTTVSGTVVVSSSASGAVVVGPAAGASGSVVVGSGGGGSAAPGYGAPGYGAPGYGAPGYGAPGYGAPTPSTAGGTYVLVGYDEASEGYHGDTPTNALLPVLCLRATGLPDPGGLTPPGSTPGGSTRRSWSGAEVALTEPVAGYSLTSRSTADALCAARFGGGWRMAEVHDGGRGAGYDFWARAGSGDFAASRFWVAIDDQRANPWDSDRGMTWRLLAYR
jgi:hypothetical protein